MPEPPEGLKILTATYGSDDHLQWVTSIVKKLVNNGSLSITVSPQALGIVDPAPGVKKILQVNVSINGAPATLFTAEDGNQLVINAPTVTSDEKKDSPAGQVWNVFYYSASSLIGAYLALSFYKFGLNGLKSWIVGVVGAIVIVLSTISFAISGSSFSGGGLIAFTLGIAYLQFSAVFLISLFFPDYISFDELNKVAETVAKTVAETVTEDIN
jgi:hypothetical protein